MRQMKKITACVLSAAIALSSMTFVDAAVSQEGKNLNKLGLLSNITDVEMNQNLNRMFGITMVMKALGYQDKDVKAKAVDNPFTDLNKDSWVKGFAAVAYENKITTGVSNKLFGPYQPLKKKEMLTFMLRVLGYDAITAWNETERLSREAGILTDGSEMDSNFTKDDAARIMYASLNAKLVGPNASGRLIDRLVAKGKADKNEAISQGLLPKETPKELAIESVKAENLRQIEVVFTRELNADSAKKVANYILKGTKGVSSRTISEATLKEDNRTVLLTVGAPLSQSQNPAVMEINKSYVLTVKDVKDTAGQIIARTEREFTAGDTKTLEVTAVEFTGPRNFRVIFSEPIKRAGDVEVRQGSRTGSKISTSGVEIDSARPNVVNVNTYNTFRAGTDYSFTITGAQDFANYTNIIGVFDLNYQVDTTAPEATVVAADQGKVEVAFNHPVRGLTERHFYHGYPHQTAKAIYKDAGLKQKVNASEYVSKVWVVFATGFANGDYPLPPNTEFNILGKVGSSQIQDNWGNKFGDYRVQLSVQNDNSLPSIADVDVQETQIIVTFNKDLSQAGTYRILKTNGTLLTTPSVSLNGNKVTLRFSKLHNVKEAILEVKNARDNTFSRNLLVSETRNIEFTDRSFDGIVTADFRVIRESGKIVGGEIFVGYNEPVANNATEGRNYQLKIGGSIENLVNQELSFGDSNRTVVIRLSEELATRVNNNLTNTEIAANSSVTDLAGNSAYSFSSSKKLSTVQAATFTKSVLLKDGDNAKLQLHFNRGIKEILNYNGVSIHTKPTESYINGEKADHNLFAINDVTVNGSDNKIVEITFNQALYSANGLVVQISDNTLEDSQGTRVGAFSTNAAATEDKVVPSVLVKNGRRVAEAYKSGSDYIIALEYTEAISANSLASGTYRIDGSDKFRITERPTIDSGNNKKVLIKVEPLADADFTASIQLVQGQSINDANGNNMPADSTYIEINRQDTWK